MKTESPDNQRWLAFELHDRLMPWIHGARMSLSQVQVAEQSVENFAIANHCLKIAAEEGRGLIGFLESLGDDNAFTLTTALEQFIDRTRPLAEAGQQEIELNIQTIPASLPAAQAWSVLRVVQQAVMNAVHHAGPCQIVISSQVKDDSWVLTVSDSGRGFDLGEPRKPNHFGLSSMQQRAEALGGKLLLQSQPGKGSTIALQLPQIHAAPQ